MTDEQFYSVNKSLDPILWHILSASSVPVREFAMAMHRAAPTLAWVPQMMKTGCVRRWTRIEVCEVSGLTELHFPLQRGYARKYVERIARPSRQVIARLLEQSEYSQRTALVCTSSFWAPVAEVWPGPVIYYVTDFTAAYASLNGSQVRELDRRLCRVAALVCPNSQRIAEYLQVEAGCDPELIQLIPNATRASNLRTTSHGAAALPRDVADIPRPIAGVIGNLAGNIDWKVLLEAVEGAPLYHWLLVGPSSMAIADIEQRNARRQTLAHPRVRSIGVRPCEVLRDYARSFDVAVLPYRRVEPTRSGSATRFYEHLAACRPMLATRGVDELLTKVPLVRLVSNGLELGDELLRLAQIKNDGFEEIRRLASVSETWEKRAARMIQALREVRVRHHRSR